MGGFEEPIRRVNVPLRGRLGVLLPDRLEYDNPHTWRSGWKIKEYSKIRGQGKGQYFIDVPRAQVIVLGCEHEGRERSPLTFKLLVNVQNAKRQKERGVYSM